ncbi:MAG TPA: MMPL family transporter [Candidatus Saccharimonadales bacterium]|nr:MMPL family transporter [Candidatus Saccharimonadales bacterium]
MFNAVAKFVVRFRWFIIAIWILAVPIVVKTLPSLTSVTKSNNSAFLPSSSPSQKASSLTTPFQGKNTSSTSIVVASSSSGPLTTADNQTIAQVEAKIKQLPNISLVRNQATSRDGQVQEILVGTSSSGFGTGSMQFVTDVRNTFSKVQSPSNLSFHLTGTLAEDVDSNNSSNSARNNTQIFIILFIIILLFVVYRSLLGPLITLIPAALSLVIASPIIAESTKIGVQVSPITQLLLIVLLLGAGTDYGIFLVFRVREELRKGHEPKEAVIQALSKVGKVITFSALTVSAALLSLLLASFGFYKGLGPALAIGIAVLLLAGLTLLPALLTVFGRAAFWPVKNKPTKEQKIGVWGRVAERVITHPVITLVIGTVILGSLITGLVGYKTGGFNNSGPPAKSDSAIGSQIISEHFPAANNNPQDLILKFNKPVWDDFSVVAKAQQELSADSVFKSVEGPINVGGTGLSSAEISKFYQGLGAPNLLPEPAGDNLVAYSAQYLAYRSISQFISPDGKTVQFYALLKAGPSGSTAASQAVPAVRSALTTTASSVGAVDNGLVSQDAFVYDISHISTDDLYKIVPVVLIIIAVLLAVLLQSLVAPWYLILTVGLSYLATLGFANIVFVHLTHNSSGLSFFLPFLLFVFGMALGEDYNILVMSRIREEAHDKVSLRKAITKSIGVTGTTVTSAGLILAGTFAVLGVVGGQSEIQQIGFSIAFGILLDTFFVRTLFVPSIAVLLGKWNWWPSKLYKRSEESHS